MTTPQSSPFEVGAVAVGQGACDQHVVDKDIEADRCFRVVGVLRPASDDVGRKAVDLTFQRHGAARLAGAGAFTEALADGLELVAFGDTGAQNKAAGMDQSVWRRR